MNPVPSITEAELEIMQVLWRADKPLKVQEICDSLLENRWKYNTVATLLTRMTEKGSVAVQRCERANSYRPLVSMEEYKKFCTKSLVTKLYNGSAKELAVSLFDSSELTPEDIEEIRLMFRL